jgi:hypothetical protein
MIWKRNCLLLLLLLAAIEWLVKPVVAEMSAVKALRVGQNGAA